MDNDAMVDVAQDAEDAPALASLQIEAASLVQVRLGKPVGSEGYPEAQPQLQITGVASAADAGRVHDLARERVRGPGGRGAGWAAARAGVGGNARPWRTACRQLKEARGEIEALEKQAQALRLRSVELLQAGKNPDPAEDELSLCLARVERLRERSVT